LVRIVVADASPDAASVEVARSLGVDVLELENRGLGYLYNQGVAAVEAEYVVLANADVAFHPHCVELLTRSLEDDESLFAADPRQLDWAGELTIHARTTLRRGPLLHTAIPGLTVEPAAPPFEGQPVGTVFANAGAMLVRRHHMLELGGFDETFFLDFEDIDLCWRAWLRGWGSVYVPEAIVRHRVGASTDREAAFRRLAASHHNLVRFALKCFPAAPATRVILAEMLRLPRAPRPVGSALGRTLIELVAIIRERRRLRPARDLFDRLTSQ
jgi:N-acetylglucosaminyl-diphospho-decaprenol L-rhamnosyltransferase